MKAIFTTLVLILCHLPGISQDSTVTYKFSFKQNGEEVTKTVEIDTTTDNNLVDLINGKKPDKIENDSIYDEEGTLTAIVLNDSYFGAEIQKFTYDDQGQLTQITGYDEKGNIAPFFESLAIREIDYDEKGRVIEKRAFDENHEYVPYGAYPPVMQITYNDHGNKQEVVYLNQDRKLHEEFTRVRYIYDEDNNLIETVKYNGNDEIIEREKVNND